MLQILCVVQTPLPSAEISIIRPFNYLQKKKRIRWQLVLENDFTAGLLSGVDLVVFHRNCRPNCLGILQAVKEAGIPVLYELDDHYLAMPEDLPIGRYMRMPQIVKTLETLLRSADLVKVGSPELIPFARERNPQVVSHPYAVDAGVFRNLQKIPHRQLVIGYAGSVNHGRDLALIAGVIPRISREFPRLKWEFIGCLPAGVAPGPNLVFSRFLPNYQEFLVTLYRRNWDIGLAPLLDTVYNRCKTDNKFREYGACGIAGIYSAIPPYAASVRHEITGLLTENTEDAWYQAVKRLILDAALRKKIAVNARKWVLKHNALPVIAGLWEELFATLVKKKRDKSQ
jgi:glycosyltransferase involved in cell wall biosynthesis